MCSLETAANPVGESIEGIVQDFLVQVELLIQRIFSHREMAECSQMYNVRLGFWYLRVGRESGC